MGPAAGRPGGSVLRDFLHSAERPASAERLREGLGIMARPFCRNAGTIRKLDNSMDWLILVAAGCMETIWAVLLKYTHGFTRFWPTAATLAAMAVSFWLLALALKNPAHGHGLRRVDGYRRGGCGGGRHSVLRRGRHLALARQHGPDSGRHCGPEVLFRLGGAKW